MSYNVLGCFGGMGSVNDYFSAHELHAVAEVGLCSGLYASAKER